MEKKIVITGANRGLGLSMAKILLAERHQLFVIIRKVSDELNDLIKQYQEQLHIFVGDVTNENSIIKAVELIKQKTDYIDMLINNSAVLFPEDNVPLEQVDFRVYDTTFKVNSIGPLMVTKHILPLIRKGTVKQIVNISSEAGSITDAWRKGEYAYCMSKSALNMASRILQNYVISDGIKVVAIHPGWFSSDMGTSQAPITPDEAAFKVTRLFNRNFELNGPMYFDLNGNKMNW